MDQVRPFSDERLADYCAFCGGFPDTRDHVPPRVFLDRPYPDNLPVVGACLKCNGGASLDEEYIACLLEVAAHGSADPAHLSRPKIARILTKKPQLAAKLAEYLNQNGRFILSTDDRVRLKAVIEKMARSLWAYETSETAGLLDVEVRVAPVAGLDRAQLERFYELSETDLFPEIGSRMFVRVLEGNNEILGNEWIEPQIGRFAYAVEVFPEGGRVKMVLGEYMAAEVDLFSERDSDPA